MRISEGQADALPPASLSYAMSGQLDDLPDAGTFLISLHKLKAIKKGWGKAPTLFAAYTVNTTSCRDSPGRVLRLQL